MGKKQFVEKLKEGDRVDDVFLVKVSRLAETRAGKPYLILELADKTGDIGGPIWENAEQLAEISKVGNFLQVKAQVQSYRDKLQLRIEHVHPVAKEVVDVSDFIPSSNLDLSEMAADIEKLINSIENSWVKKLLKKIFKDDAIKDHFRVSPAAKGIHHAYVGGLIEHCLSMAKVANMVSGHYPGVSRSILLAGVLLHDIGKLKELKEEVGVVDYTSPGRLKGHLVIGSEMVGEFAGKIKDFPEEILTQIQHLILSHHGRLEFGSPTVPMTVEAFLLSYIDDLDSKMNLIEQLRRKQKGEGLQWSEYQRTLERFLYLGPLEQVEDDNKEEVSRKAQNTTAQQSLF